jgi:hypothetical protein
MAGYGSASRRMGGAHFAETSSPSMARASLDQTALVRPRRGGNGIWIVATLIAVGAAVAAFVLVEKPNRMMPSLAEAPSPQSPAQATNLPTGSLRVDSKQPGVRLYVDDKEIGTLPQEVRGLSQGSHSVKFGASDRYQPLEKQVLIEKDQILDLGSVLLKVVKGKATFNPGTPGARAYLVSGTDRRELPSLPISVDIDTAKTWSLEANKPGFVDFKQTIGFDDGQAEKSFTLELEPKPAPAAPTPRAAYTQPTPAPAPAPPPPAPAPAPAEVGEAFLNINSIPPSTCFLDGRSLGSTPRVHVSVKPGTHTVKFINADEGLSKTVTVSVGSGETKPAVAKLN